MCLRESCMRENRMCSLGGGRRPARKRASSDPTWCGRVYSDNFRVARDSPIILGESTTPALSSSEPTPLPLADSLFLDSRGELFVAQRDYRVQAHSAARRKETRYGGHRNEQQHDARKC